MSRVIKHQICVRRQQIHSLRNRRCRTQLHHGLMLAARGKICTDKPAGVGRASQADGDRPARNQAAVLDDLEAGRNEYGDPTLGTAAAA